MLIYSLSSWLLTKTPLGYLLLPYVMETLQIWFCRVGSFTRYSSSYLDELDVSMGQLKILDLGLSGSGNWSTHLLSHTHTTRASSPARGRASLQECQSQQGVVSSSALMPAGPAHLPLPLGQLYCDAQARYRACSPLVKGGTSSA